MRRLLTIFTSILAVGLIATTGFAAGHPAGTTNVAVADPVPSSTCDQSGAGDGGGTQTDTAAADPCEDQQGDDQQGDDQQGDDTETDGTDTTGGDTSGSGGAGTTPLDPAACAAALGDTPPPVSDGTTKLHGLDNAIAHVLANCEAHPTPGLVNALAHLAANATAHAAKPEVHGNPHADAVHGNPHTTGVAPGNSGNAHSGVHGNPHTA